MVTVSNHSSWLRLILYLLVLMKRSHISSAALKPSHGHILEFNTSIQQEESKFRNEHHFLPSEIQKITGNYTRNNTHGARVRRSVSIPGACAMSKSELHGFYSGVHAILSTNNMMNTGGKISSFNELDCSVCFQKILDTVSYLKLQVSAVLKKPQEKKAEYKRLKAQYEKAIAAIENEIRILGKQKTSDNPKIQAVLRQINELTLEKNAALVEQTPLTDYEQVRKSCLKIVGHCTTSERKKRGLSVPSICQIQPARLEQLHTLLQSSQSSLWTYLSDSLPGTFHPQNILSYSGPNSSQLSCDHRKQSLQSKLLELSDSFRFALKNPQLQSTDTLTRNHRAEVARLTKQKDDLRQSIYQNSTQTLGTYQNKLQSLQVEVDNILTQNDNLRDSELYASYEFASLLIRCGENAGAVYILERWRTAVIASNLLVSIKTWESIIRDVVLITYSHNLGHLENLLNFANQFQQITEVITANEAIYERMEQLGQLRSPKILLLAHQVDLVVHSPAKSEKGERGSNENRRLQVLASKLEDAIKAVILTWGSNINSGDMSHIIQYPQLSIKCADAFNHYLPRLVQTTYRTGRLNSFKNILQFGSKLHWYSHTGTVLSQLFLAMKSYNDIARHYEITLLAYMVRLALLIPNEDHVIQESKHLFQGIKNGLSRSLQVLVWDSWVKIWSRSNTGYTLYGTDISMYTLPDHNDRDGSSQRWTVKIFEYGRSFKFINRFNGKVLCAESGGKTYAGDENENNNQLWDTYPASNDGDWVYLKNRATARMLNAGQLISSCGGSRKCCCSNTFAKNTNFNFNRANFDDPYEHWKFT